MDEKRFFKDMWNEGRIMKYLYVLLVVGWLIWLYNI